MATSPEIRERIGAFAGELCEELGEVDDRGALSWFGAIRAQAVEIGDALQGGVDEAALGDAERGRRSDLSRVRPAEPLGGACAGGNWSAAVGVVAMARGWSTFALVAARLFFR